MSQIRDFVPAPRYALGELVPPPSLSDVVYVAGAQKPTNIWKVLAVGPGFKHFPDLKPGDHLVPEKESVILLDQKRLSMLHEERIFGVCPKMTNQVETLTLAPKFILALRVEDVRKTESGIVMPEGAKAPIEMRSSFWRVLRIGPQCDRMPLAVGQAIAIEKHAIVTLDRREYAIVHEEWIYGALPADDVKVPS